MDNDEENDGFIVPHGYLSSDEEQNDNGMFQSLIHFIFLISTFDRMSDFLLFRFPTDPII